MSRPIYRTYGQDERPELQTHDFDTADGDPVDLTGFSSVTVRWRLLGGATNSFAGNIVSPETDGRVSWDWPAAMMDTAGTYGANVETTDTDGTRLYKSPDYIVKIIEPAGGVA